MTPLLAMTHISLDRSLVTLAVVAMSLADPLNAAGQSPPSEPRWRQHEMNRPRPAVVTPPAQNLPVAAPADAVVLFDGRSLSGWARSGGEPAAWKLENGYMEIVPRAGSIQSKEEFGDVQLHVEWAAPNPPRGSSQDRGNSGILLFGGRYEVQVLDSYQADTYADGQAGAIYGQYPPLFNATRPPGEWQAYDIYFRRPRFRTDGSLAEPARVTVVLNGILVQNNEEIRGPTTYQQATPYSWHADQGPIQLQDHNHPVRYRNIWARRLPERPLPTASYTARPVTLSAPQLDRLAGTYFRAPTPGQPGPQSQTPAYTITREGDRFMVRMGNNRAQPAIPVSENELWLAETAAKMTFRPNAQGTLEVTFDMGGSTVTATKRP